MKNKQTELKIGDPYSYMGCKYKIVEFTENDTAVMELTGAPINEAVSRVREVPVKDLLQAASYTTFIEDK